MKRTLIGLAVASALSLGSGAALAQAPVPRLDHVFVIVLENHNSFTSFGSNGILDNPKAPHIQQLAKTYNFASDYNAVWQHADGRASVCAEQQGRDQRRRLTFGGHRLRAAGQPIVSPLARRKAVARRTARQGRQGLARVPAEPARGWNAYRELAWR
jgi:hypothetical protein